MPPTPSIPRRAFLSCIALAALALPDALRAQTSAPTRTGAQIYGATCITCHMANGGGNAEQFPPLVGSEYVLGSERRLVGIILHGLTGPIEVEGQTFSGLMPPWGPLLSDEEIALVATYVRTSWGNKAAPVTKELVAAVRAATKSRATPLTVPELAGLVGK
jgi:mono/diheme cytochrome c family protein